MPSPARTFALALACALASAGCPRPPPPAPVVAPPKKPELPLQAVTLQMALEAAWDGDFTRCFKDAKTAITIASDDLESMELMMRCARATGALGEAEKWVREAYSASQSAPVVRYGLATALLLRGDAVAAEKAFEKLADEAPVAAYQGAMAAKLADDWATADRLASLYLKARPEDPDARMLEAEVACMLDVDRCGVIEVAVADEREEESRRIGAALGSDAIATRATLDSVSKDAEAIHAAAYSDALSVAVMIREGGDPGIVGVRSPRSGRREPGPGVDLVREARPMAKLPFATRVAQGIAINDGAATGYFARLLALFPTDFLTYRVAAQSERVLPAARTYLEEQSGGAWRVYAASWLVNPEQVCDLANSLSYKDQGAIATSIRRRCDVALEKQRGRALADARLTVTPYGLLDVRAALEGEAAVRDANALEALARRVSKAMPSSKVVVEALLAAADAGHKGAAALQKEALALSGWDPVLTRRALRRYVERSDWKGARALLPAALQESPSDAYLNGVQGALLAQDGKADAALPFLTRACNSAKARRESELLTTTYSEMWSALPKAKIKPVRDAALRCLKGD